ncbi:MAG: hypothetical protein WDA19_04060 [Mariniphaga sp.]
MKTIKIFTLLFIATMLISSCKKDDDGVPRQMTKTYEFKQEIRGSEQVLGTLPAQVLKLSDIIGADPAENFQHAEMQLANSYLKISGLSQIELPGEQPVVLKDFTIKVGTHQGVNLGDCSTDPQTVNEFLSDAPQSTNQVVALIETIFNDLTSGNRSTSISVSFTPNVSLVPADNVQLIISIGGTYHYLEFE